MKFKTNETLEDWFFKRKSKEFPNDDDYTVQYKHIKAILKSKIQDNIMIGATLVESKKDGFESKKTLTGHDPKHFQQVIKLATELLNTGSQNELTAYEVFFLLVAIQIHDIGNILGRDNHESSLFEVFNDLFKNDMSIDSVEKHIYLSIASAHSGSFSSSKDKIREMFKTPTSEHNGEVIKVRYLAAILRFADELADTPSRALGYIYDKNLGETGSEIFHEYAKSITSTIIKHNESSIAIMYSLAKKVAEKKFYKGNQKKYLLDEIFSRVIKIHFEKLYCQRFFYNYISLEHMNVSIKIFSDNHNDVLENIKLRLIEQGYPDSGNVKIKDICEDPESSLLAYNNTFWSGTVLKSVLKKK